MKSERRHELKENDLAHALESVKLYLDEHGKRVGLIVVGCAAVIITITLSVRAGAASMEDRWRRKTQLTYTTPDECKQSLAILETLIADSSDEQFNLAALMDQGMHGLRLAQDVELPPDKDLNDIAARAFQQLLQQFSHNKLAVGAAHAGLATVAENRYVLEGDIKLKEEARRHLQAILDTPSLATLPFHKISRERLAALDRTFTPVRFVAAPEKPIEEAAPEQPKTITITPQRIPADELPDNIVNIMKLPSEKEESDAPSD